MTHAIEDLELATIAVMTFNRAQGLRIAVASALAQDYPSIEVIISDNGSTDETQTVAREFLEADPRVRYIRHDTNIGAVANFNGALRASKGAYFMWLADDDWLDTNFLTACIQVLRDDEGISLVGGHSRYEAATGAYYERPITLVQPTGTERLVEYYRSVSENGVFYGVARTSVLRGHPPLKNVMATDWLHAAGLAFSGSVVTVNDAQLVRSTSGSSHDVRRFPAGFGFTRLSRTFPLSAITSAVAHDVLRSHTFSSLAMPNRIRLAVRCSIIVYRRVFLRLYGFTILEFGSRVLRRCLPPSAFDAVRRRYLSRGEAFVPDTD